MAMRILTWGPSVTNGSGYSRQLDRLIGQLLKHGHTVAEFAYWGGSGSVTQRRDAQTRQVVRVYPKAHDTVGNDIVAAHARHFQADIVLAHTDTWALRLYDLRKAGVRVVPWFPIAEDPLPVPIRESVRWAYARIAQAPFGVRLLDDAGLDCFYAPTLVDTSVMSFRDRFTARRELRNPMMAGKVATYLNGTPFEWPDDCLIFGMVAANNNTINHDRKCFRQNLMAFKELNRRHPDTRLYLHTNDSLDNEEKGINLPRFIQHLGLEHAVVLCNQYHYALGYDDTHMAWIYSALDCLLAVSMGEGFCNPLVEAACCGTTAITSGWTAPADLCPHGWTIPVDCAEPYWLEYMQAYHYVPHISAIIDTLEQAYQEGWTGLAERGSRAASWGREHFDMETVFMKHWIPILAELERRIRDDAEREQIQVLSGDKTREEEASA